MTIAREDVQARLTAFAHRTAARPDLKAAAVAVCLVPDADDRALLITRRAARLSSHAGQLALPGGRIDPGETIEQAALRELREETGIDAPPDSVLGRLDDYVTRSGYVISPVAVWVDQTPGELGGAPSEVAAVHRVPLRDLDVPPRLIAIPESDRPVIQVPLFGGYVHAPTAAVVHQFCEVGLHGRPTRVDHFEQPVFAWR